METEVAIPFAKYSGAGNDFIIIDARSEDFAEKLYDMVGPGGRKRLVKMLCRRGHSIGADGLLFIEPSNEADFAWDFYNSDGSDADMCGNAARCVARFCHSHSIAGPEMKFKTKAGIVKAKILDGVRVEVMMLPPRLIEKDLPILVDSGVPHVVIRENKINDTRKLREIALTNRFPQKAGPRGANVTFFAPNGPGKINAISFERGVEDFTLACGTGAMAAAFVEKLLNPGETAIEVRMPGGRLEVEFPPNQNLVLLRGPACKLSEGVFSKEACHEEL
ncbi:MAG: diaminopimelate epimerase [Bdellovibrionia bacterium]